MTPFVNIHSHQELQTNEDFITIVNLEAHNIYVLPRHYYSIGIHPYRCDNHQFYIIKKNAENKQILAIGESGIDHLVTTSIDKQIIMFKTHALLAEQIKKPLIIHQVRSQSEILAVYTELKPKMPWIIHGFRGKREQAEQFINKGFYLSFGMKFNVESLKYCPLTQLFLETDESTTNIQTVYKEVCDILEISIDEMKKIIYENFCNVFLRSNC